MMNNERKAIKDQLIYVYSGRYLIACSSQQPLITPDFLYDIESLEVIP
jgi:hypothetical protein